MKWFKLSKIKPIVGEEVLVYVNGHRGPSWSNDHMLVAYMAQNGEFYEERHDDGIALAGVISWCKISPPKE